MKEILEILKNIKKGPLTSIVGILFMLFGGYLMYTSEVSFTWASVEVGLLLIGSYLLLSSDLKL